MKAAVVHEVGGVPRYEDFPDPVPREGEVVVRVRAVAVENVDRAIVAGQHYAAARYLTELPMIPTFDGVGELADGTLVTFGDLRPPYGALAELCAVDARLTRPIPAGIDPAVLSALSSAVTAMSIRTAGELDRGQTVLVQGGTGVAGRLSIKIARLLGAGRIVATGRDDDQLRELRELGADTVINTAVPDDDLLRAYRGALGDGYHVIADYLWGRPTGLLLRALIPETFALGQRTRLIQIGELAGAEVALPAASLRTSGLQIVGAATGFDADTFAAVYEQVLSWIRAGELTIELETVPLRDIEAAWCRTDLRGRRLVVTP
ncbi:quinone oxidoreductase family protein [Actinocatenispora sera]|uniref:Zinc-binding dehydrogenase n=1 Tax=Actinocatenispora sera TaxID=390989 RepID=A0A810L4N6_9ACTN|nr:zinc-binding alcohol dehydrogenase family protein [Actinocatenispora sera]BCJ30197.1 zinc-binding dehydrogenase [Actinocatenispora sera]